VQWETPERDALPRRWFPHHRSAAQNWRAVMRGWNRPNGRMVPAMLGRNRPTALLQLLNRPTALWLLLAVTAWSRPTAPMVPDHRHFSRSYTTAAMLRSLQTSSHREYAAVPKMPAGSGCHAVVLQHHRVCVAFFLASLGLT